MIPDDAVEAVVAELRLFNHHKAADLIESLTNQVIPDDAVEAGKRGLLSYYGYTASDMVGGDPNVEEELREGGNLVVAILEAALPTLLSHEREETRLAHLDAVVNAAAVDRLEGELADAWDAALQDADDQGYLVAHQSVFMKARNPYRTPGVGV